MSKFMRSSLGSLVKGSAAAGFGFSGGRSAWGWFEKRASTLIPIVLILAGSGLAGFYLRSSDEEGFFRRLFLVWLPAIVIILLSLSACLVLGGFVGSGDLSRKLFIWQGIAFVIGLIVAQPFRAENRRTRRLQAEAEAIEAANRQFLRDAGLREVGGRENTMIDEHGREIVLDDIRSDAMLFRIKGRRGVRSRIVLDENGRMVAYEAAAPSGKRSTVC